MHRIRLLVVAIVCAVGLVAGGCADPEVPVVTAPATPQPTATEMPTASPSQPAPTPAPFDDEPGISATTIRVGVIADVEGTKELGAPRQISAWEAVTAWAETINATGGLARRTVEVVPIDSKLFRHADAIDQACGADIFALVGSAALNDSDGLGRLLDIDCALPDFPAVAQTIERLESPVTTVSNPIAGETWNAGWARYYAKTYPGAARAASTLFFEFPTAEVNGERMIEAARAEGFRFARRETVSSQTDFVEEAAGIAEAGARSLVWRNSGSRLLDLLAEIEQVGVDLRFIDCGQECYSRSWVAEAGRLGRSVSVWLPTVPFEDAELNRELLRYLVALPGPEAVPTVVGVNAWAAALLFEAAVNLAIGVDTPEYDPDSISRAGVIEAAHSITSWDANGLHGVSNPAERLPSPCFTVMTLSGGEWQRVHPTTRGEPDCDPENLVQLQFTETLGESADVAPTPTDELNGDSLGGDGNG